MTDQNEMDYFVDSMRSFFRFLIESRQWTGFGQKELNAWISNFSSIRNGEYIACKILDESIGYSENDIVQMMKGAISDILNAEIVKEKQLLSGFSEMRSTLEYDLKESLERTLFVPLSVNDSPGESGDAILRTMTQKMDFPITKKFQFDISDDCKFDRVIIVDDCIGSGEQFSDFWNDSKIKSGKLFRSWCHATEAKVYYIVLVGCEDTVLRLKDNFCDCEIRCVELLKECHKVLTKLKTDEIFGEIEPELNKYLEEVNINLYGFNDMEFAVFMHNNIPDWSLPVLYKSRMAWKPLLRRKDSDV